MNDMTKMRIVVYGLFVVSTIFYGVVISSAFSRICDLVCKVFAQ